MAPAMAPTAQSGAVNCCWLTMPVCCRSYLRYIPLPGGDAWWSNIQAVQHGRFMGSGRTMDPALPPVVATTATALCIFQRQFATGFNTVPTSSMGRLFDAVALLAGVRQTATYEAQAAIDFEALASDQAGTPYRFALAANGECSDAAAVIQAIAQDVLKGVPVAQIAADFHQAVAIFNPRTESACAPQEEKAHYGGAEWGCLSECVTVAFSRDVVTERRFSGVDPSVDATQ